MATLKRATPGTIGTRTVPGGVDWDAVCVPRADGLAALHKLGRPGAVLVTPQERELSFFVPPGATSRWPDMPGVRLLGSAEGIAIPPSERVSPPGPYWLVDASEPWALTDPEELRWALLLVCGAGSDEPPVRGDYVVDMRPVNLSPPSDPWIARVQMPLDDGTVRVVAPHGVEWVTAVAGLRPATDDERAWFDAHVPHPGGVGW